MKLVNFTLLFKRFHESLIIHESPVKYFWRGLFNVRLEISDLLERGVLLLSRGSFSHFHGGRAAISKKKILHIFNKLKRENCLECRKYECVCQRKIFLRTLFGLKSWKRQHSRKESLPRPDHKEYRYVREERDYYTDKKSTSMVIKRFTTQCFPIHYPRFKTKKNPERQQSILS